LKKQKDILEGEGEAAKKRLIMQADGALERKLAAWVEVNKQYAEAIKTQKWVPDIQMGGSTNTNAAQSMIDLLMVKTAKDLDLELKAHKEK